MKLFIYTNLKSLDSEGFLCELGLDFEGIQYMPIKGLNRDSASNHVRTIEEARRYDILLCHQGLTNTDKIIPLLDLQEEWAIILHISGGAELRNLPTKLSRMTSNKILYCYEHSQSGLTFDLLASIKGFNLDSNNYKKILHNYFLNFEKNGIDTFIKDLLSGRRLTRDITRIFDEKKSGNKIPYIWRYIFKTYPKLCVLLDDKALCEDKIELKLKIKDVFNFHQQE